MMNQEELTAHIRWRKETGYTDSQIRTELSAQGYSETEVENALLLAKKLPKPAGSPLMLVVSLLFIALGIWQINKGATTWGAIIIGWGVVSFIIRVLPFIRK